MKNREIARIFREIADFLEAEEVRFKPFAYRKAALSLESLKQDIGRTYKEKGLKGLDELSGIGQSMAEKIEEYLKKGKIDYHQKLKKKTPIKMEELVRVEGIGPKKAIALYRDLGVADLKGLKKAAEAHKIAKLEGFGQKTEKNILQGLKFLEKEKGRFLLGDIFQEVEEMKEKLKSSKLAKEVWAAGSVRRMKETIGDIDILAVSGNPSDLMDFFVSLPLVVKVWGKGKTKSSVRSKKGFDMDLRIVPGKSLGAAMIYFTGSKEHNIALRKIAIAKGLKLSEYGLFKGKKAVAGLSEKEVYNALGLDWIPPEIREDQGEVEAARKKLPELLGYRSLKGDLHWHSDWDGGQNSIEEMAKEGLKMGYSYMGLSDHTKFLKIEKGLDEKKLAEQRKELEKINGKFRKRKKDFRILQGAETNILKDGSLDIKDSALKKLDYAVAGIHSQLNMGKREMTERIIRALKNPYVNIIAHPTGRILQKRESCQLDLDKVFRAARECKVALEINSFPERLDLNCRDIKRARQAKVKMAVNSDSHHKSHLRFVKFGIGQARRGWAEEKNIINSWELPKLLDFFKK